MQEGTQLIAEHYQKTYELTLTVWEQRNRTFLILLIAVGVATLLTFDVSQAQPLLADLIAKTVGIEDVQRRQELRASFPYGIIQSILLMTVLYFMVILYHRTAFITRSYSYLNLIEGEIRRGLSLPQDSISFTREGSFYRANRPALSWLVAIAYVGMLGLLLAAFLGMRIYTDIQQHKIAFAAMDILLAVPTVLFFAAYALVSQPFGSVWRNLGLGKVA